MIARNGVVIKDNGRPAMLFDGVDDYLFANNATFGEGGTTYNTFVFAVNLVSGGTEAGRIWSEGNSTSITPRFSVYTSSDTPVTRTLTFSRRSLNNIIEAISTLHDPEPEGAPADRTTVLYFSRSAPGGRGQMAWDDRVYDPRSPWPTFSSTSLDRTAVGALFRDGVASNHGHFYMTEFAIWSTEESHEAIAPYRNNLNAYLSMDSTVDDPW